ncbi:hypothetical protein [Coraliomargarita algicola]|uniref:sirohydrochlorin chelatase n=1 Tax=Coraliomargarita algicola TaxID=3092156 RepID=UPI0031F30C6A
MPLFLGPSLAITDYLPQVVAELKRECPELKVQVASVLAGADLAVPDLRLAQILADQVRALPWTPGTRVALVDHGSPIRAVNHVRNTVARQLEQLLQPAVELVQPCSMERRSGAAYAFNEPLLEGLAQLDGFAGGRLILAMFFLLPGRHAGEGGDVAEICDGLVASGAFQQIQTTPLLGEHPLLLDILVDRLRATLS